MTWMSYEGDRPQPWQAPTPDDTTPDDTRSATAAAFYAAWREWADAAGEPAGSQRAFAAALACRGFRRDRTESARLYHGISLREAPGGPDA